jgi:hypothetical protein
LIRWWGRDPEKVISTPGGFHAHFTIVFRFRSGDFLGNEGRPPFSSTATLIAERERESEREMHKQEPGPQGMRRSSIIDMSR